MFLRSFLSFTLRTQYLFYHPSFPGQNHFLQPLTAKPPRSEPPGLSSLPAAGPQPPAPRCSRRPRPRARPPAGREPGLRGRALPPGRRLCRALPAIWCRDSGIWRRRLALLLRQPGRGNSRQRQGAPGARRDVKLAGVLCLLDPALILRLQGGW